MTSSHEIYTPGDWAADRMKADDPALFAAVRHEFGGIETDEQVVDQIGRMVAQAASSQPATEASTPVIRQVQTEVGVEPSESMNLERQERLHRFPRPLNVPKSAA